MTRMVTRDMSRVNVTSVSPPTATPRDKGDDRRVIAHHLFVIGEPVAEKAIRTAAVYVGVLVLLRVAGKRDLAQLNTFDLVVLLLLSNVVQNAVIGDDNSLVGGLLGAVILVGGNAVIVRVVRRNEFAVK